MIESLSFYNMKASILFQGTFIEENVAIKKIWEKPTATILDVYFHRTKQTKIIDALYIKSLEDLSTGSVYNDIKDFIKDYKTKQEEKEVEVIKKNTPNQEATFLKDLEPDLIILSFMARISPDVSDINIKVIHDFVKRHKSNADILSEEYITSYLDNLEINEDSFYDALKDFDLRDINDATELLREVIKISATDGVISYYEKKYIAEIVQAFRDHGINPDIPI